MGLFSSFKKNKQESASDESEFLSRSEEESNVVRGRGKRRNSADPIDPVLPEKKRARRRLVGAIALVLAVIFVLPLILDSEPKPIADDIAIQIPSKDKNFQPVPSMRSGIEPAASASRQPAPMALDKTEELIDGSGKPAASSAASSVNGSKVIDEAKPVSNKTDGSSQAASKSDGKPDAKSESKSESKQDVKAEMKTAGKVDVKAVQKASDKAADDAARAKAILEGKPAADASHGKSVDNKKEAKFVLQVAAFATQEKINELEGKLKDAGIAFYTQKIVVASGELTRIRVGPFASKEEADKARAKLTKLGLNGTPVAPGH